MHASLAERFDNSWTRCAWEDTPPNEKASARHVRGRQQRTQKETGCQGRAQRKWPQSRRIDGEKNNNKEAVM
jgi:hypothetical protein